MSRLFQIKFNIVPKLQSSVLKGDIKFISKSKKKKQKMKKALEKNIGQDLI